MTSPLQAQYDAAMANPDFTAKLMAGDPAAKTAFHAMNRNLLGLPPEPGPDPAAVELTKPGDGAAVDLLAPDAFAKLPAISTVGGPYDMSDRQKLDMVETMRQRGTDESVVREAMDDNRTYSPELKAYCQDHWNLLAGDSEFRAALFRGEASAERKWRAWCVVASGNVKG
jgi:hypothetical protein